MLLFIQFTSDVVWLFVFSCTEAFSILSSDVSIVGFVSWASRVSADGPFRYLGLVRALSMFSSSIFIVSDPKFRSLIHLELVFIQCDISRSNFILPHVDILLS